MSDHVRGAMLDTLDYLMSLQRDAIRPERARSLLQDLRTRHPDLKLDLLAESEAYGDSIHYDMLLRRPGDGTVSMSYCPDRAIPWAMRGARHSNEYDLVRVNSYTLTIERAVGYIDAMWDQAPLVERLLNTCLIEEELERDPIAIGDAELQERMNVYRAAKGLLTAKDTFEWLEGRGMTHDAFERFVANGLMMTKLRDRIGEPLVEEYFSKHSEELAVAKVARLVVDDREGAESLAKEIRAGRKSFFEAATEQFSRSAERAEADKQAMFAVIERRRAAAEIRASLFASQPGDVVGPVAVDGGYELLCVIGIGTPRLDAWTRAAIKQSLFEAWLAERRAAAQVEWFWGNASRAGNSAPN